MAYYRQTGIYAVGVARSVVARLWNRFQETGNVKRRPGQEVSAKSKRWQQRGTWTYRLGIRLAQTGLFWQQRGTWTYRLGIRLAQTGLFWQQRDKPVSRNRKGNERPFFRSGCVQSPIAHVLLDNFG
ncbi:hypothetical protein TNCV_2021831 [Trichonephila clavipes]|nr:hypothetical protein TNCV_2021831 [Trichonephila clavipes]